MQHLHRSNTEKPSRTLALICIILEKGYRWTSVNNQTIIRRFLSPRALRKGMPRVIEPKGSLNVIMSNFLDSWKLSLKVILKP
jgi:hypothetical protein